MNEYNNKKLGLSSSSYKLSFGVDAKTRERGKKKKKNQPTTRFGGNPTAQIAAASHPRSKFLCDFSSIFKIIYLIIRFCRIIGTIILIRNLFK